MMTVNSEVVTGSGGYQALGVTEGGALTQHWRRKRLCNMVVSSAAK